MFIAGDGSEPLGPKDGDNEVDEEGDGYDAKDCGFHGVYGGFERWWRPVSAHLLAEICEGCCEDEEADREEDEGRVAHRRPSTFLNFGCTAPEPVRI